MYYHLIYKKMTDATYQVGGVFKVLSNIYGWAFFVKIDRS